jgi:hypothetical protein
MSHAYLLALSEATGNVLRYVLWVTVAGLGLAGVCLCGGFAAYAGWATVGPPFRHGRRHAEAALTREAARGITEIEAFLAAQLGPRGPEQRPQSRGDTP